MSFKHGTPQYYTIWGEKVRAPDLEVVKLQADLMEKSFTREEKKKIPGLTPGFKLQRKVLMLACDDGVTSRLKKCGKLDQHRNRYDCQVVFCPRCMMLRRRVQSRENIKLLAHLGNGKLAFMTVLVKIITDLNDAKAVKDKFAWRVRNAIIGKRREDPRWNNVMVKAYWEFDNLRESDDLGRNTKIALEELGWPEFTFGSNWLLHFHAIVALGDITIDELKEAIRRDTAPHPYQVNVKPFRTDLDVNWNIRRTTRYSMKYRIEDHYKRTGPFDPEYKPDADTERKWWPKESVGLLVEYLSEHYNGYRSQQFWIGAKAVSKRKTGQTATPEIEGDVEALASVLGVTEEDKKAKASSSAHALISRMKSKTNESRS